MENTGIWNKFLTHNYSVVSIKRIYSMKKCKQGGKNFKIVKVHIIWEGHKTLQNFVAFSEDMNFKSAVFC